MTALLTLALLAAGPPAAAPRPLTLAAAGDVTLGYHFEEYVDGELQKGQTAAQLDAYPFAHVAPVLAGADLAVFNLECPFTSRGEKLPKNFNFRARPDLAQALPPSGVDAVSLANNHMMDYGPEGIADTLAALDALHLAHFGAGATLAAARRPAIVERAGVRVAFLGYLYIGDPPIEPLAVWAGPDKPGVAGAGGDEAALIRMIREDVAAAQAKADLVVVFFHFGKEGLHAIQPYQADLAHAAVDAGANLVLGSHPHVLQGAEWYRGVPVVYSLGNFVFGGNWNPRQKESAIFRARFEGTRAASAELLPVQITRVPEAPFQPLLLGGEARSLVLEHLAEYSSAFPKPLVRPGPF